MPVPQALYAKLLLASPNNRELLDVFSGQLPTVTHPCCESSTKHERLWHTFCSNANRGHQQRKNKRAQPLGDLCRVNVSAQMQAIPSELRVGSCYNQMYALHAYCVCNSPLDNGKIVGLNPRCCPSANTKKLIAQIANQYFLQNFPQNCKQKQLTTQGNTHTHTHHTRARAHTHTLGVLETKGAQEPTLVRTKNKQRRHSTGHQNTNTHTHTHTHTH